MEYPTSCWKERDYYLGSWLDCWIAIGRVEEIAKEIDDGRQSGQQQKIAAAAESGRGPVDRHAQHAQGLRRSTGPVDRKTLTVMSQALG